MATERPESTMGHSDPMVTAQPLCLRTKALLLLIFGAMGFQVGAWALSLPAVVRELGIDAQQLGFTLSGMAIAGIAATVFSGRIAERITVRITLTVAAAASGIGYLIMPLLDSYIIFTIGAMATGAGLGMFDVAANAAGSLEERRSGRTLLSTLHAVFSFAAAGAAVLSYVLNGDSGYAPAFFAAGVVCIVGAGAALLLPSGSPEPGGGAKEENTADSHNLARISAAAALLAFVIVCGSFTVDATLEGFSALFISQLPGQGAAQSAFGLASLYIASALGRTVSTTVINRFGDWRTLLIGLCIVVAGVVVLIWIEASWASAAGMLLIGFGIAPAAPIGYSVMGRSRATGVERATARLTTAGYGAFVLAPMVIGVVGNESLSDGFRLLPILLAAMILVTAWFGYRHNRFTRKQARPDVF
ncbi:MAG: MFS transporter [Kocuria sp.]|nr:MFS transporter [Kocuria sp.]